MGTAVLHPQGCLAVPQSDRHRRFLGVSEYPSEASILATECRGDVALCNTILSQSCGRLGLKNASAGLLPLPNQASQSAHSFPHRLAPPPCRSGEITDFYVSKHSNSSYASDVHLSRCSSVPMLEHAARTRRFFSESFPLHAVQLHERRLPRHDAKLFLNSAQAYCMAGSSPCAARAALPREKHKFLANSHFSDVVDPVGARWVNCIDGSVHYRKRMHPEVSQVEVHLGRQCAKPPLNALPDGQGETICTNASVVCRKHGGNKQLKRSASEKRQERVEVPILQRPSTNEAAIKLTTNLFEGVVGSPTAKCHSSKIEVKLSSSAPPSSSLEGKIVKALQTQASLDADSQGSMRVFKTSPVRSSQLNFSQQMGGTERNVGASLHGLYHGCINAAMEQKEVNEGDQIAGTAECVSRDQYDLRKVDEMWVSMINDERWAGPSFFNSPSPSSLPLPSFTLKLSRIASTVSVPTKTADHGAQTVSDISLLEAKRTWDVAFATKDLRRILNLDHASCDL